MTWQTYTRGTAIAGHRLRITGKQGQYNEGQNVFDMKPLKLPAGLIGRCEVETQNFARVTFRKYENYDLWSQIDGLAPPNRDAGTLSVFISPSRLLGVEVER
jgi:hypothetical protein